MKTGTNQEKETSLETQVDVEKRLIATLQENEILRQLSIPIQLAQINQTLLKISQSLQQKD